MYAIAIQFLVFYINQVQLNYVLSSQVPLGLNQTTKVEIFCLYIYVFGFGEVLINILSVMVLAFP